MVIIGGYYCALLESNGEYGTRWITAQQLLNDIKHVYVCVKLTLLLYNYKEMLDIKRCGYTELYIACTDYSILQSLLVFVTTHLISSDVTGIVCASER